MNEKTSKDAASAAARVLRDPNASEDAKTAAGSALTQRETERDEFRALVQSLPGGDHKRRAEPVAWLYEDELPDNYPYAAMFPYSKVDGVRMFPVYAPQPAEPVSKTDWNNELSSWSDEDFIRIFHERPDLANRLRKILAEPVKVPSDEGWPEALYEFREGQWWVKELDAMKDLPGATLDQKRAVSVVHHMLASVARYGQPADWQDFPK